MKSSLFVILVGLTILVSGCMGRNEDPNTLKYGKEVDDIKSYWKDGKGHHFVGTAENQVSLEAGRRLALLMAHRAVSEKIGTTLRAETSTRLETSGVGSETADRSFSDIVSQVSQNLLSGMTPERAWHQSAVNKNKMTVYKCFHQVVISDEDLTESIERARELYEQELIRDNEKWRSYLEKSKDRESNKKLKSSLPTPSIPSSTPKGDSV